MKRKDVLKAIEQELLKNDQSDAQLVEIRIIANNRISNKDRFAFCYFQDPHTQVVIEDIVRSAIGNVFKLEFYFYQNIQIAINQVSNDEENLIRLENNWRGRLFDIQSLIDANLNNNAQNFMLRSVWRIIIQRDPNKNYYVRHDIFPIFWSHGHFTTGWPDYVENFTKEFQQTINPGGNITDEIYDVVKVFARANDVGPYQSIHFNGQGEAELLEVGIQRARVETNILLGNLVTNLRAFFNN